jgi:hypothetical protein
MRRGCRSAVRDSCKTNPCNIGMTKRAWEVVSEQYGQEGASVIAAAETTHLTSYLEHQVCLSLTLSCTTTAEINLEIGNCGEVERHRSSC